MKGDFTRDTFDPTNHFSRVLMQQGRVTLDADPNEQTSILLHYLRTLAADLIGPYGAPVGDEGGFSLSWKTNKETKFDDLKISKGRYYVDGILVENDSLSWYSTQPDYPLPDSDPFITETKNKTGTSVYWLYLDVWERHITSIEDDYIREKALNGPDTCTRTKVVWQVKAIVADNVGVPASFDPDKPPKNMICDNPIGTLVSLSNAWLAARVDPGQKVTDACVTPPNAQYRGTENQLYRVEIHTGGEAGTATFKWSRDNGSIVTAWLGTSGADLLVQYARGFEAGDWVELSDDTNDLQGSPGVLVKLAKVEGDILSVDPATVPSLPATIAWSGQLINPKVRRWNQTANDKIKLVNGAVPITESPSDKIDKGAWINLEDGVQVQFRHGGAYRTGDYWLIPARVATGQVEWPVIEGNADFMPPDGIEHHYAPLGFVWWDAAKTTFQNKSCRCTFKPQGDCFASGKQVVRPIGFEKRLTAEDEVAVERQVAVKKKRTKVP